MDQERRGQWLRGVLDLCVLAALHRHESYGYELAQSLQAAGLGPIKGGTLYPVLLRLQRTGLVDARWRAGTSGPARKYYRLTESGARRLRQATSDWRSFATGVDTILPEVTTS
ncbi:PadR family transcriptional regulator PadR [Micromonospora sp. Llam0]|uniref:PadR family transcriptional regulator n=1 Tax=Micromonospora sp. Llam0 TaxID=2485143 RepID=UPI000F4A94DE|nr:PadR family transcriptional regulator [Micromonospora sp. Llam0]ROO58508.1 PadR family transcriptional regulator PadR [Micromonospora sp. Llam0]